METVGVVGAGTMGAGIAHVLAQAGLAVLVYDSRRTTLDQLPAKVERGLGRSRTAEPLSASERDAVLARLHTCDSFDALASADFVIEAAVEDLVVKRDLFRRLDALVGADVILASNTSSLSITRLGAATGRPDRVIGMHFMNPVPAMPLVEIVRGARTSTATLERTVELAQRLAKTPVEAADYPGFLANRILMPMINEAIYALMEGVGTADGIDKVMTLGMNHPMGPLTLADFIGLDVCLAILNVLHEGFGDPKYRPCPLLRKLVDAGELGRKSGRGFFDYPSPPAKRS